MDSKIDRNHGRIAIASHISTLQYLHKSLSNHIKQQLSYNHKKG